MTSFEFFSVPRIVFGRGQISRIGELSAPYGSAALVVFNGSDRLKEYVVAALTERGIRHAPYRQRGEPKVHDVDAALNIARSAQCEFLIAIGGGSAIDCGKAVAALLTNGGDAVDYMEVIGKGQKITKNAAPWIAIPTTAGTGAEVTRNAVIGSPERKFKASIRGQQLLASVALIDPELGIDVPPGVTAASGMDALCQCIEAYTSRGANPMTDDLALRGVRLACEALKRAFSDGSDIEAREKMALTALLSGIALTNAGLGAVHGFAAPIGANFPAPHGVVCAALLPHVLRANVEAAGAQDARSTLWRYNQISAAMGAESIAGRADSAAGFCARLAEDLKIPRLRQFGMSEADIPPMVELAKKASSMKFNPVPLSDAQLAQVLREAI